MHEPNPQADDGLAKLRAALERLPGVRIAGNGGTLDDDGWWHISLLIDREHPGAWHTIAVLAKLINTDRHDGGSALFKPSARLAVGDQEEDLIMWSLSHQFGEFTPQVAAEAITRQLADEAVSGKAEE
jgi:hypothetical protein